MKKALTILAICLAFFLLFRCDNKTKKFTATAPIDTNFKINFNPIPPTDLDTGAGERELSQFAWEEFLALNWKSSFNINGKRDYPDSTWSYQDSSAAYPELNVWETFAHRTELRPYSDQMQPFNNAPHYSFGNAPAPATPSTSFTLFNNLDENNEIGSCDMYARVNLYQKRYQVLYEAKVNSSEYNYILNNYPTKARLLQATSSTAQNIARYHAYYPNPSTIANDNNTCDCPASAKVVCLPCSSGKKTGAIEIKAAWRMLTPQDDSSKFFTRKVIYYTQGPNKAVIYHNATYALIGLHIIQKTRNYPAFIFATFEHVNVIPDSMGYVLLKQGKETGNLITPSRDPIRQVTQSATDYVHRKLPANSIWQNYRLVGVQAKPVNYPDTANKATNFFLSNYVVESDITLSHFNGGSIDSPHNHRPNLLYKGKLLSMGGCQGCHGATQKTAGTDFSFLLDTVGKPILNPDIGNVNALPKLTRYINAAKTAEARIKLIQASLQKKNGKR
ncbi:hypothetical protein [Mucilaginibacter sp.]|jgi:hypothetical protein|uniref:hypothetical protein n=1 Tax=Mucilaginibacter sp. TaxID=1882438 RepID=UPI0035647A98